MSEVGSTGGQRLSAVQRLNMLPALFRGSDATTRFGWSSKEASQYFFLWKRRDYIAPLGGHSDVYANLLVERSPDWDRALLMAMPSAVLMGLEVLRNAGWSTQVPHRRTVAVREGAGVFTVEQFDVSVRPREWFAAVRGVLDRKGTLPALPPAWALADLVATEGWGGCGLHPSDLDWDEIGPRDHRAWAVACERLGVDLGPLEEDVQMANAQAVSSPNFSKNR